MLEKVIKIYSTPTCHFCHQAKDYFAEKKIPYVEINVVGNSKQISDLQEISGQRGVPVIILGDEVLVGWNREQFDATYTNFIKNQDTKS